MFFKPAPDLMVAGLLAAVQARPSSPLGVCQDLTLAITVTADTIVMPPLPDLSQPGAVLNFLDNIPNILANIPLQQTSGTYNIAATYCRPEGGILPDRNEVQLLVYGASYTKEYWIGRAWDGSDDYSWTKQANKAGYGTLAVTRLNKGVSERPDPVQVVQLTLEMEVLNVLTQKIESGEITGSPSKVIYIGHSLASQLDSLLAAKYPNNINNLVLTGYTTDSSNIAARVMAGQYHPAKDIDPAWFSFPPQGYLTQSVQSGRTLLSYAGRFLPSIPFLDFSTKKTQAISDLLGTGTGTIPVSNYLGPLFILTGDKESAFCGTNPNAPCKPLIPDTASKLPQTSTFGYFTPRHTGHGLIFHYTAAKSFAAVIHWLKSDSEAYSSY